jgi:hypothetical protein
MAFLGGFAVLTVAAMPILGIDWPIKYVSLLLGVADWQNAAAINPEIMHNWRGFFSNLFGDGGLGFVGPFMIIASILSVVLALWAWLRSRRRFVEDVRGAQVIDPTRWDLLWAVTVIVAVLISPHLNPHDLALLIFPAWIAGAYAMSTVWHKWVSITMLAILWATYLLAPLTMYSDNPGLFVIPSVLLMVAGALLLAWQAVAGKWRVETVPVATS